MTSLRLFRGLNAAVLRALRNKRGNNLVESWDGQISGVELGRRLQAPAVNRTEPAVAGWRGRKKEAWRGGASGWLRGQPETTSVEILFFRLRRGALAACLIFGPFGA
jgi:hypothetical protein